jgi:hypothetical protein
MCVYTSGCEDEVDTSCNGPGLVRRAGCNDAFLFLGDLSDLGGSGMADCWPVFADGGPVSSGSAPCTSTSVRMLCTEG